MKVDKYRIRKHLRILYSDEGEAPPRGHRNSSDLYKTKDGWSILYLLLAVRLAKHPNKMSTDIWAME